jgi:hypothetical protein
MSVVRLCHDREPGRDRRLNILVAAGRARRAKATRPHTPYPQGGPHARSPFDVTPILREAFLGNLSWLPVTQGVDGS